jgi:flagellar protein FliS
MSFRSQGLAYTNSYKDMHVNRVQGASPHQLVAIMFEELLVKVGTAIGHLERGDVAGMIHAKGRALAIVTALEESLDFDRGGDTAIALAVIYREASERLARANGPATIDILQSVQTMISEIYSAWIDIDEAA